MGLYRCMNCTGPKGRPGKDFEGVKEQCPECGALPPSIVERACIHFDAPSGIAGRGANDAACNPGLRIHGGNQNMMMTGVPAAVTCPKCRKTDLWQSAAEAMGIPTTPADKDVPVTINLAETKITPPEQA